MLVLPTISAVVLLNIVRVKITLRVIVYLLI